MPEVGHVGPGPLDQVQDPAEHRGHDHGLADLLGGDRVDPALGVEAGQVRGAPTPEGRREDGRDPGDVVRRHAHELRVVLRCPEELDAAEDVRRQVPVAQDRDLGIARGATGEQEDADVVGVDGRELVRRGDAVVGEGLEQFLAGDRVDAVDVADPLGDAFSDDDERWGETFEDLAELLVGQAVVHRRKRDARRAGTEQTEAAQPRS